VAGYSRFFGNGISYQLGGGGGCRTNLRRDFRLEDAAEAVAQRLLQYREWRLRSLRVIRHHLGCFDDDELRQILVRAGAIRFSSKSGD